MVVYLDFAKKTARGVYVTTFDGSEQSRRVSSLVESYDPTVQAVLQFREIRLDDEIVPRSGAEARILDIETKH